MKRLSRIILITAMPICTQALMGNDIGHKIIFDIPGAGGKKATISCFHGLDLRPVDSSFFNAQGKLVLIGKNVWEEGLYLLKFGDKSIDFIVHEQRFTFSAQLPFLEKTAFIIGSEENKLYFNYKKFVFRKKWEADSLRKAGIPKANELLMQLNQELVAYRAEMVKHHPNSFATKIILAGIEPKIPRSMMITLDSVSIAKQMRAIQFQNLDLSDARLIRTPYVEDRIMQCLMHTNIQLDSLAKSCDFIMEKASANPKMKRFALGCLLKRFEKNDRPMVDLLYTYMAQKYYLPHSELWSDTTEMLTVKANVARMEPILTGKIAPPIDFVDSLWRPVPLYSIKAPFTILYFWDADCSHCQELTPKLLELYTKYKEKGVEVYAVTIQQVFYSWKEYIQKHNLTWINVWEPEKIQQVYNTYQVGSTPAIYLLDKDKRILLKKVSLEELEKNLKKLTKHIQAAELTSH